MNLAGSVSEDEERSKRPDVLHNKLILTFQDIILKKEIYQFQPIRSLDSQVR